MATKSPVDLLQSEQLNSRLDKYDKNFKEVFKVLKIVQNSLDLIYNDRDLIKDNYAQGEAIKGLIIALDKHNENLTLDVKADVADAKDKVEVKSEEIKDTVEHHVGDLADQVNKKKILVAKKSKSLFQKLLRR